MKLNKQDLINGNMLELETDRDSITFWFSRSGNFCLMLNAKCIKSTKTLKTIQKKLNELLND